MRKIIIMAAAAITLAVVAIGPAAASATDIGNAPNDRALVDTAWNFTIVDTNNPATVVGRIASVNYWAEQPGSVRFVLVDSNNTVTWVSDQFTALTAGLNTATFTTAPGVTPGTNLGYYSPGFGVVSYEYSGNSALYGGLDAGQPTVGSQIARPIDGRTYSMMANIIVAPAPVKDSCKDGGWKSFTASPGPFKNQGQCVSHYAAQK